MRWLNALLVLLAALLPGCVEVMSEPLFQPEQDCSTTGAFLESGHTDLLLDAGVEPRVASSTASTYPRLNFTLREGQHVLASALWNATAGDVQVVFDGPGAIHQQEGYWSAQEGIAPETREYVLELRGAPVALEVGYVLTLFGVGCTPVVVDG